MSSQVKRMKYLIKHQEMVKGMTASEGNFEHEKTEID
jgi:hypothetical protein